MRSNELRIGNLLSFNNMITKEEIVKVSAWFLRQLVHDPKVENPQLTGYYQPIPLTEEWLIKLGFEKVVDDCFDIQIRKEIYISIQLKWFMVFTGSGAKWTQLCDCKHVHQLQNLYFALTGKELTLKK